MVEWRQECASRMPENNKGGRFSCSMDHEDWGSDVKGELTNSTCFRPCPMHAVHHATPGGLRTGLHLTSPGCPGQAIFTDTKWKRVFYTCHPWYKTTRQPFHPFITSPSFHLALGVCSSFKGRGTITSGQNTSAVTHSDLGFLCQVGPTLRMAIAWWKGVAEMILASASNDR